MSLCTQHTQHKIKALVLILCFVALSYVLFNHFVSKKTEKDKVIEKHEAKHELLQERKEKILQIKGENPRTIWIDPPGSLLVRYKRFSEALHDIKDSAWQATPGGLRKQWKELEPWDNYFIQPDQLDFLDLLYMINATTAFLTFTVSKGMWSSKSDTSNLLVHNYHEFAADTSICRRLQDRDQAGLYYTWMPYCSSDKEAVVASSPLHVDLMDQKRYLSAAYDLAPFPHQPPQFITHLSFLPDVLLGENGSVIYNYFTIFPQSVPEIDKEHLIIKNFIEMKHHSEVLSLAGLYQTSSMDTTINNIQRIIPYLHFLKMNSDIKIHIGTTLDELTVEMLGYLDIPKDRLISGVVKSQKAYFPQPSHPGFPHVQNIQILSHLLREQIKSKTYDRPSVVFIRRNSNHKFGNELEVQTLVEKIAEKHQLEVDIYSDHPAPSIDITMKLFNRASLVVAPHGASLYNMIFCKPQTYIIEVFCPDSPAYNSLRMAHMLGLRYYAHTSVKLKNKPCFNTLWVDLVQTEKILDFYMPLASKLSSGNRS